MVRKKKNLNDRDRGSFECLVNSNRKKSTVTSTALLNSESRSISTRTMRIEFKALRYVALRNHLSARLQKKLQFARDHKD